MIYDFILVICLLIIIVIATISNKKIIDIDVEYVYDKNKLIVVKNDNQYSLEDLVQEYNKIAKSIGFLPLKRNGENKRYDNFDFNYHVHRFKDPSQERLELWTNTTDPGKVFKLYALKNSIENKISNKYVN